jgi:hypothetical protein
MYIDQITLRCYLRITLSIELKVVVEYDEMKGSQEAKYDLLIDFYTTPFLIQTQVLRY